MKEILSLSNLPMLLTACRILEKSSDSFTQDDVASLHRINDSFPEQFRVIFCQDGRSVSIPQPLESLMCLLAKHTSELETAIIDFQNFKLKDEF